MIDNESVTQVKNLVSSCNKVLIDSDSQNAILTLITHGDKQLLRMFYNNMPDTDYTLLSANMISTAQSLLLICIQQLKSITRDDFTHFNYSFGSTKISAQALADTILELRAINQARHLKARHLKAVDLARQLLFSVQDDPSLKTPDYDAKVANDFIQNLTAICSDLSPLNWKSLHDNISKLKDLLFARPGYIPCKDNHAISHNYLYQIFPKDLQERLQVLYTYLSILSICDDLHKELSKEEEYSLQDTFVQAFTCADGPWNIGDYRLHMALSAMIFYQLLTRRYSTSKLLDPTIQLPRTPDIMKYSWWEILHKDGTSSLDPASFPEIFHSSVASSFRIPEDSAEPTNHFT